ncbi:MAG TPA: DNA-binding protein [Nitrososphaeraceae archaeon]|nr:DNA-binding protein [Nitrososphaeraceae archaeon]
MPQEQDDPDIEIIKARKLKELREQAAALEKAKKVEKQQQQPKTSRDIITSYLYDRGEEVLNLAESQFPNQTRTIVDRIAEFIKAGEINQRISGGELLALFRSIGINIRINTSIKIEDHGKMVSFSDKLKQENEDM